MLPIDHLRGLTQSRLKELLSYDPETGEFTRLVTRGKEKAGSLAGNVNKAHGYVVLKVDRKTYLGSRLAWLYMTGSWPEALIDHENLDRSDTRWSNLRPATYAQNQHNTGLTARNTSGLKGVSHSRGRWQASIRVDGRLLFLGRFSSPEQAHAAYAAAAAHHFGNFARAA